MACRVPVPGTRRSSAATFRSAHPVTAVTGVTEGTRHMSGSSTTGATLAVIAALGLFLLCMMATRSWRRLQFLAEHDELTGLLSRPAILREAASALQRRGQRGSMALLSIDLDGFQRINDQFSHQVGDEVLKVVAEAIVASTEPGDAVGRLGGDEFVVVRPSVGTAPEGWAEQVRRAVSDRMDIGGTPLRLTASAGLVVADASVGDVARLLRDVD